jgi:predicted lipoprotein with Yx(FWY)xxD motif
VTTAQDSLGRILVSSRGRTLYLFEKDKPGTSSCYGGCAAYWPPLLTTSKPIGAAGVKAGLLGATRRTDGTIQVTYAGHPLYTFALDTKAGQTKGQGAELLRRRVVRPLDLRRQAREAERPGQQRRLRHERLLNAGLEQPAGEEKEACSLSSPSGHSVTGAKGTRTPRVTKVTRPRNESA